MKKLICMFLLFFSFLIDGAINSADGDISAIDNIWNSETMTREKYLSELVEKIEFEAEVKIPKYVDLDYIEYAYDLTRELKLSVRTVFRLMYMESRFVDTIVSPVGAYGFMQLMPETEKKFGNYLGVDTLNLDYNRKNIYIGLHFLNHLHRYWSVRGNSNNYSWTLTLASYNAGKGRVIQYKGIPPFKETMKYIDFIQRDYVMSNNYYAYNQ